MQARSILIATFISSWALLAACDSRPGGGGTGGSGGSGSCVGACGGSGGSGGAGGAGGTGGSGGAGGSSGDGGTQSVSVNQARKASLGTRVFLTNVVVTGVLSNYEATKGGCSSTTPKGWYARFWVADPNNPKDGIFIEKYCADVPLVFPVAVGDLLDIDGWLGTFKPFEDGEGYRLAIGSERFYSSNVLNPLPMTVTKKGTMSAINDNIAPVGFGRWPDGGILKANPDYVGARVEINGPLSITNIMPTALKRVSAKPGDNASYGFEVSGGVLVNTQAVWSIRQADGGYDLTCDWLGKMRDGGSVTFPKIKGVWETYTQASCSDGGTDKDSCFLNHGKVPGYPDASVTNVMYPLECPTDVPGTYTP